MPGPVIIASMDMRVLNYFIAVYEERSFTKASERAHVVQSALSMQIRNLEDELGSQLFDRNPRGLEPTATGNRFYELAVPIARSMAAAKQEVVDLAQGNKVAGSIKIGLPPSVCHGIVGELLCDYATRYPNVELSIVEAYSRHLTEQVQQGLLDAALGAMPADRSSLIYEPAFIDHFVLVSGAPVFGDNLTPCDLHGLRPLKLIMPSEQHLIGSTIQELIKSGQMVPDRVMRVDGVVSSLAFARQSDWVCIFPAIALTQEIATRKLFIYPIARPALRFDLYRVHDPRRPMNMAIRAFFDMLDLAMKRAEQIREVAFRMAHP